VPATIGFQRSVPFVLTATELRDALQEGRLGDAAKQKLASDINVSIMNVARQARARCSSSGPLQRLALMTSPSAEAIMNERGVQMENRLSCAFTRDYNGMASNLPRQPAASEMAFPTKPCALASLETWRHLRPTARLCEPQSGCCWRRRSHDRHARFGCELLRAKSDQHRFNRRNVERR
jgi:hypothetical protein